MIERTLEHWRALPNLSIEEACTVLGVSDRTVRNLLEIGDLRPHMIGRRRFVTVESVRRVAGDLPAEEPVSADITPQTHLSPSGQTALQRLRETG